MSGSPISGTYRGRVAPSPTGLLHLGHARTFLTAARRAGEAGGDLVYRDEDLDRARCNPEFAQAGLVDLARLGIVWQEGPDIGGPYVPYRQSERLEIYRAHWRELCAGGWIYPCTKTRKEIQREIQENIQRETQTEIRETGSEATTREDDELDADPVFPTLLRPPAMAKAEFRAHNPWVHTVEPGAVNWRLRVPDGETIDFRDGRRGDCAYQAGRDFGDFLVWRKDGTPSYEFAVVVDDFLMRITEVVRGADLLKSTARQLLLYRARGWRPPDFFHCDLVRDDRGRRLAKRHDSLAIRALLDAGRSAEDL